MDILFEWSCYIAPSVCPGFMKFILFSFHHFFLHIFSCFWMKIFLLYCLHTASHKSTFKDLQTPSSSFFLFIIAIFFSSILQLILLQHGVVEANLVTSKIKSNGFSRFQMTWYKYPKHILISPYWLMIRELIIQKGVVFVFTIKSL